MGGIEEVMFSSVCFLALSLALQFRPVVLCLDGYIDLLKIDM